MGVLEEQIYIVLFGTGIRGASTVTATIAGMPVPVTFSGPQPQFAGLDQVNLRVPSDLAARGLVQIRITADSQPANIVSVELR